ncbi:MAG: DUF4416 family protein [Deltaproteobacteria bacterium]
MSIPHKHKRTKLFSSIFASDTTLFDVAIKKMSLDFGNVDFVSAIQKFDYTNYYQNEFGEFLSRRFVSFKKLICPEELVNIKIRTNEIEKDFIANNHRCVNIDPGYIALQHVILATCKGFAHRPYLRDGIYADLTLVYQDKNYKALEWTYPDYANENTREMFGKIRAVYHEQLCSEGNQV